MPRVTQAHVDARRREILSAAHRCFARDGFRDATMQEIAHEAGLSAGALYQYFDGKDALIEALAELGRSQKRTVMASLESPSGVEGLAELIVRLVGSLPESERGDQAVRFDVRMWGEALGQPALQRVVGHALSDFRDVICSYVEEGQQAGRIRSDVESDAIARVALSLLAGLELQLAFEPGLDPAAYVETVGRLLRSLEGL